MTTTSTGDGEFSAVVGSYSITDDIVIAHDVTYDDHVSITGTLTVNAGKTFGEGAASKNLTVSGDATVNGTLDLDRSSSDGNATFGSLTINSGGTVQAPSHGTLSITGPVNAGWLLNTAGGGTFTHNNGLVHINAGANSGHIRVEPYNLKTTMNSSSRVIWRDVSGNVMTVANDLTIVEGGFDRDSLTDNLTVTGDVVIEDGGKIGDQNGGSAETGANTFGSLTINSGGTYDATSGTTTITDENSSNYAIQNNGTFTHNSGTVSIETADHTSMAWSSASQRFNNLTINLGASGRSFTQASGFGDTDNKYIEGDLQITNSTYNVNNQELRVDGDVTLSTNAVLNGATGDVKFGSLTINSGTTYNATSGTTTITKDSGAGSSSNRAAFCHASGTFTHNNGLFKTTQGNADVEFTSQSETNNPFYNFEATQYAIAATAPWVVLNNMTIANGFQFNGGTGYAKVYGIMKQTGGTYNASDVSSSTNHFFNHYRLEGGTLDLSNIDITVGSIRNTGGTIT